MSTATDSRQASEFSRATELVAGAAVAAVLTIATIIYVGRTIGPAEYADFSAALAVIYLVGLALSPLQPTVARLVTKFAAKGDLAPVFALRRSILRWVIAASCAFVLVTGIFLTPLTKFLKFLSPATLLLAVVAALVYVVITIDRGVLQGIFRFREFNVNTVLECAIRAILIGTMIRRFPTATFAIASWVAALLVAELAVLWTLGRLAPSPSTARAAWDDFIGLLRPMILLMLAVAIFQNTDVIAVKRWLTAEQAGMYGAAAALVRGFGSIFVPLYVLSGPLLTHLHEQRRSVFGATLRLTFGYFALSSIPIIVVAIWPEQLIAILYGPRFTGAGSILAPLAGITVVTYAALMISQALITLADTTFIMPFFTFAVGQIVALMFFHDSFREVLTALWIVQSGGLIVVALFFLRAWSRRGVRS